MDISGENSKADPRKSLTNKQHKNARKSGHQKSKKDNEPWNKVWMRFGEDDSIIVLSDNEDKVNESVQYLSDNFTDAKGTNKDYPDDHDIEIVWSSSSQEHESKEHTEHTEILELPCNLTRETRKRKRSNCTLYSLTENENINLRRLRPRKKRKIKIKNTRSTSISKKKAATVAEYSNNTELNKDIHNNTELNKDIRNNTELNKDMRKTKKTKKQKKVSKDANNVSLETFPLREIVIDGCNIAMTHGRGKFFSSRGIELVVNYFQKKGHTVRVFLPRLYQNICRRYLNQLYVAGILNFTPSRKIGDKTIIPYDDRYILEYATRCKGIVVSTDQFRDLYQEREDWRDTIENRLLEPTFVDDQLMFPDDPLGKNGPALQKFLRCIPP